MPEIYRTLWVPYTAVQMFDLVNDVESYPIYLPWCSSVQVFEKKNNSMLVRVNINSMGISAYFETYNTFQYGSQITISLVAGSFQKLDGSWVFSNCQTGGSMIEFHLAYQASPGPLRLFIEPIFEYIATTFMDLFIQEAKTQYGE